MQHHLIPYPDSANQESNAKDFYLENAKEQEFLAQSCLTYLVHYSSSNEKSSTLDDLVAFPLLRYVAQSWFYHSSFQESANVGREVYLLNTETPKLDWLLVHQPDRTWKDALLGCSESTANHVSLCSRRLRVVNSTHANIVPSLSVVYLAVIGYLGATSTIVRRLSAYLNQNSGYSHE